MNVAARLLCLGVGLAAASAHALDARLGWQHLWTDDAHDYRLRDAVVDPDGRTWVLLTARDKGAPITAGEMLLWRVGAGGAREGAFEVMRPAAHGTRDRAAARAFVRLDAAGQPVVAARTDAGISVVTLDADDGTLLAHWLIDSDHAPVAFEARGGPTLTLMTAQRVFSLDAAHAPRALPGAAPPARLVAAQAVEGRMALVAVQVGAQGGAEAHVGWLPAGADDAASFAVVPLDWQATLRHTVSVARGDGLMLLSPMRHAPQRWQTVSFDARGQLVANGSFDLPPRGKQPLTLDAQPLDEATTLLASARGAAFWLAVLDREGGVTPVALADDHGRPPAMFALDVRLRAASAPRTFMLLGTQATANEETRRTDYGIFVSRAVLSAPESR